MNIFVETSGPYVYRSIFRKIPSLRKQEPAGHTGTAACPACGFSFDPQDYPAAASSGEPEPNPEIEPDPPSRTLSRNWNPNQNPKLHRNPIRISSSSSLTRGSSTPLSQSKNSTLEPSFPSPASSKSSNSFSKP